jgi:hypothetical protein
LPDIKIALLILMTISAASVRLEALEIPQTRLSVPGCIDCCIPYLASYPLDKSNDKIEHVILAVHSSNYDARMVFNNCISLLKSQGGAESTTLVIAPQFLTKEHTKEINDLNLLFWKVEPFRGSSVSTTAGSRKDKRISPFTILEDIILQIADKKTFPNVKRVTILGHSAGGQLVNRFAASNTVEFDAVRPAGIKCRYIVMNPSSYVYMSPKRYVKGSEGVFAVPKPEEIKKDETGYNEYGYGLEKLYVYHKAKGLTAEKIRQMYPKRNVVYMLGEKDVVPDAAMSINPSAMLQGRNRLERGRIYYKHLIDEFGPDIEKTQKLVIVPGAGHSGKQMMLSQQGRVHILKP